MPPADFVLPYGATAPDFPMTGFPGVPPPNIIDEISEDSSTLSNCSNSAWP